MTPSPRTLSVIAIVAGCFVLVVGVALWLGTGLGSHDDPLQTQALIDMNAQLQKSPGDVGLRQDIRDADLALRVQFFERQRSIHIGAWLLLIGAIIAIGAAKLAQPPGRAHAQPTPPDRGHDTRSNKHGRRAIAATGALAVMIAAAWILTTDGPPPWPTRKAQAAGNKSEDPAVPPRDQSIPDAKQVLANWPAFRGPGGLGLAPDRKPPRQWHTVEATNILWKVPIETPGHSSPIVWEDRIFITAATEAKRSVLCYALDDGRLLWEFAVNLPSVVQQDPPEVMRDTGYAAPTPATDGSRVYAIFANGDLVALDLDGKKIWHEAYGTPSDLYGHSNSLICHGNSVIVQMDQYDEEAFDSLTCFDGPTGEVRWEVEREVEGSWASLCMGKAAGREQLITIANPWAIAYNPADGKELWRRKGFRGDVANSPILAGDLAILMSPADKIVAVRADAQGEITDEQVVWQSRDTVPDVTSPVADQKHLYTITTTGALVARQLSDGKVVWRKQIDSSFRASPVLADGHLFLFGNNGRGYVLNPAEGSDIGGGPLGAPVAATPAFVHNRIIVRTERELICVGVANP